MLGILGIGTLGGGDLGCCIFGDGILGAGDGELGVLGDGEISDVCKIFSCVG